MANLTPQELAALCAVSNQQVELFMRSDRFSSPVTMHLMMIQAVLNKERYGSYGEVVMPLNLIRQKNP